MQARASRYKYVMSGFSAVVTTGIYCRPGLLRAPRPGQREALRPRSRRRGRGLPGLHAVPSVPRGRSRRRGRVRGRLPRDPARRRGRRDGMTARTPSPAGSGCRRGTCAGLFQEQVGVTPVQLARSSRAHFARRLLDDTDLPITDIAFAVRLRQPAPVQPHRQRDLPRHASRAARPPAHWRIGWWRTGG